MDLAICTAFGVCFGCEFNLFWGGFWVLLLFGYVACFGGLVLGVWVVWVAWVGLLAILSLRDLGRLGLYVLYVCVDLRFWMVAIADVCDFGFVLLFR